MREMGGHGSKMFMVLLMVLLMHSGGGGGGRACGGAASEAENFREKVERVNKEGPYIGILVPTNLEMNPLLQSPSFKLDEDLPYFDFAGRRLHMGSLESKRVLIVLTGSRMLNADLTTKILLVLILLKGVIQCGVARNANSAFQVGDVTIPLYWAHTGLFNWQRYGDESVSLSISHLHNETSWTRNDILFDELLKDDAWYQPEELFPRNGTPEARNASWVRVSDDYFTLAKKLEDMELEGCVNYTTCLPSTSIVRRVQRGISVNKSVKNTAYRHFLSSKFNVTPIDMESAAVAQICREQNTPFIAIVALFDLATNGNSTMLNESNIFASLAARNAAAVTISFVRSLSL